MAGWGLRKGGNNTSRMKRGKGGLKVMGMRKCICKGEDGVAKLLLSLMQLKGLNIRVLFMMLLLLLSPMELLMDLQVCFNLKRYYFYFY